MTDELALLVDRAVLGPALVYGSPPPLGRDLDLCVREPERHALRSALPAAGFTETGRTWWRAAAGGGLEVVDLRTPADWGLPAAEVEALFAEALPIAGYARLVRPSPSHALLLLARRAAGRDGRLDERRRARLRAALDEDPQAWQAAGGRAPAWGARQALAVLRQAAEGAAVPRRDLVVARAERLRAAGSPAPLAWARAAHAVRGPASRGSVVAISGLDGAGKSSQAQALAEALEALGRPAVTRWTRLSADPSLDAVAKPVKRLLRAVRRRPPTRVVAEVHPSRLASPEQRIRQASPTLTWGWALVVAVANARAQRRSTRAELRSGRSVVCDRWTLDSAVHLRYRYGEDRSFVVQLAVIQALSPRPVISFFLDIPAETAYARKDDHYDVDQLRRHERLYREEHARHGAVRLDGTRPPAELAAAILVATLDALHAAERRRVPWRRAG